MFKTACIVVFAICGLVVNGDDCEDCKKDVAMDYKEVKEMCSFDEDTMKMVVLANCESDKKCTQLLYDLFLPDVRFSTSCQDCFLYSQITTLEMCQMVGDCPALNVLKSMLPGWSQKAKRSMKHLLSHKHKQANHLHNFARSEYCDECKEEMKEGKTEYEKIVNVELPKLKEDAKIECSIVVAKKEVCEKAYKELIASLEQLFTKALDIFNKQSPNEICTTAKMCP